MTYSHVISVIQGEEFLWSDKMIGAIRDRHVFRVEPMENGKSRFVQSDQFVGGLSFLIGGVIAKTCMKGYQAFNRSLKAEVERRYQ